MKKVALFLNGEKPQSKPNLSDYDWVVCADGAYQYFVDYELEPDLIIGDFDSIESLPNHIPHVHTPDQDFTDFEKALTHIIEKGFNEIDVFAANGMEQDHFLGNLTTALKYKNKCNLVFYDDNQAYYFINKQVKVNNIMGKTVSLFPFPKATKVFTKGLQYAINGKTLNMKKNKIGTRNKAVDNTIEIQFNKGNLLLFIEL